MTMKKTEVNMFAFKRGTVKLHVKVGNIISGTTIMSLMAYHDIICMRPLDARLQMAGTPGS